MLVLDYVCGTYFIIPITYNGLNKASFRMYTAFQVYKIDRHLWVLIFGVAVLVTLLHLHVYKI